MGDIEQAIMEVNGTMAIEGMPLTESDKENKIYFDQCNRKAHERENEVNHEKHEKHEKILNKEECYRL